ncbi:GrpB family protein [Pseudomonas sp. W22_MBD1_FP4]|uniref:GrpB family protein n=1 Tax=Pseudomonas sp. W22_MBD1_FP4 TaxID=3240272 RepID=UPI003F9DBFBA
MNSVEISEHSVDWGKAFTKEAQAIRDRLQNLSFFIDHVGSTSVPGLSAKPIIDILISLQDWVVSGEVVKIIQELGYQVREKDLDTPRYFLVNYSSPDSIGYHIHICKPQSTWEQDMINFREELCMNDKLACNYARLKEDLAKIHKNDVDSYALGKKEFIEKALKIRAPKFSINKLLTHQNLELDKADRCGRSMMWLQLGMALTAAFSVYVDQGWLLLLIALMGFGFLAAWLMLSQSQQKHRSAGDQARRAVLFMSGLGKKPSLEEQQRILKEFILPLSGTDWILEESRFASREFPGYQRLAEIIEESAFWTGDLHHASAELMSKFLWGSLLCSFTGSIAAIVLAPPNDLIAFNRALIAVMLFFISSDMLGLYFAYKRSATSLDEIFHRVEISALRGYLDADILLLASDYNAVIENSPSPLIFFLKSRANKLSLRWTIYKEMKREGAAKEIEGRRSY